MSAKEKKINDSCVPTAKNNFHEMQIWFVIWERTLANNHMFATCVKEDFRFHQIWEDTSEMFTSKFSNSQIGADRSFLEELK